MVGITVGNCTKYEWRLERIGVLDLLNTGKIWSGVCVSECGARTVDNGLRPHSLSYNTVFIYFSRYSHKV